MSRQKQKQQFESSPVKPAEPKTPQLIKMVDASGKPADVHPDEVESYKAGGYEVAK